MDYPQSIVWKKAIDLAENIFALAKALPREERFGMRSQMTRAATSVPSNIAEGWLRESRKEKLQFFAIAHGSLAELHTQLLICVGSRMLSQDATRASLGLIDEISRILTVLKRRWRKAIRTTPQQETPTRLP